MMHGAKITLTFDRAEWTLKIESADAPWEVAPDVFHEKWREWSHADGTYATIEEALAALQAEANRQGAV